jgi:tripartite-type tricarboxylate transporter receptor subunit TctC
MVGSAAHLMVQLLGRLTGSEFVHTPLKSDAQTTLDTLAGRVPLTVARVSNALPHLQSGRLVAIAMLGGERSRLMPDVPTPAEPGIKGMDLSLWFAMFAPAGTPSALVTAVTRQLNATLRNPGIASRLEGLGFDPSPDTPARLDQRMKRDEAVFATVVRDATSKPD